ncbi:LuxR C-terminal-related transcriptional regulator [Nitrospira sp. Kam-Ns4a]
MKHVIAMLARAADGAFLVDDQGTIRFWNRAAERLTGYRAAEAIGRSCHEVLRGETPAGQPLCSPACAIAANVRRGAGVRNFDLRTRTRAGRPIWLNVSSLPVPSARRNRFWAVHLFRDVSRQARVRHLVDELQAALCCAAPMPPASQPDPAPVPPATLPLSKREREILAQLALGKTTKGIADALCVSPATVRNHIQHILEKLSVHSRLEALAVAFHPGQAAQ